jgi:hypothetical protein
MEGFMRARRSAVRSAAVAEAIDEGENFEGREEGRRRRRARNRLEDEEDVQDVPTSLEEDERRGGRLPTEKEREQFRNQIFHDVIPARVSDDGPPPPKPLMPVAWHRAAEALHDPLALVPPAQHQHFHEETQQVHNLLRSRTIALAARAEAAAKRRDSAAAPPAELPEPPEPSFPSLDALYKELKRRGAMLELEERIGGRDRGSAAASAASSSSSSSSSSSAAAAAVAAPSSAPASMRVHSVFQITPEAFVCVDATLADDGAATIAAFFYWPPAVKSK